MRLQRGQSNIRIDIVERKQGWQSTTTRRALKIRPFTTTANSAKRVRKLRRKAESIPTTFLATGDYVKSADRSIIMSPPITLVGWHVYDLDKFNRPNICSRLLRDLLQRPIIVTYCTRASYTAPLRTSLAKFVSGDCENKTELFGRLSPLATPLATPTITCGHARTSAN